MRKQIIIIAILTFVTACSDVADRASNPIPPQDIETLKEFVIPDTIDVRKELVIAAYYEMHPQKACVIMAYDDTLRTSVKRYSYSNDSTFVVKELELVSYKEFKLKEEPSVSYIIKPNTVVWMLQRGNTAASAEFERIDVGK